MHASLASIGRAYNVEDEEPPDTPKCDSVEVPSDGDTHVPVPNDLPQLIESAVSLSSTARMVSTCAGKYLFFDQSECSECQHQNEASLCPRTNALSGVYPIPPSVTPSLLDRMAILHRLCDATQRTVHLEILSDICSEVGCGLWTLSEYACSLTENEYEVYNLLAAAAHLTHHPFMPLTSTRPPVGRGSSARFHGYSENSAASSCPTPPVVTPRSQLSELRMICEGLRQCLTQVRKLEYEQKTLRLIADTMANSSCTTNHYTLPMHSSESLLESHTSQLMSSVVVAAHHLVYCGLRSLTMTDLTAFTHGDLWEMTRGIEELNILSKHLQSGFHVLNSNELRRFLCARHCGPTWKFTDKERPVHSLLRDIMVHNLVCTPWMVISPISVGYMFDLIARQRSIRLAKSVYTQLSAMISMIPDIGHRPTSSHCTPGQMKPIPTSTSLVDAFRVYLHENYDRSAVEYLRSEYEFISGFLDVLSQSTNLLYEVHRLNSVYAAAEALLVRHNYLTQGNDPAATASPLSCVPQKELGLYRAVSVEGKHGILTKRISESSLRASFDHENLSTSSAAASATIVKAGEKKPTTYTTRDIKKAPSTKLQEILHRSGTLDRYVATGSCISPFTSTSEASCTTTTKDEVSLTQDTKISPDRSLNHKEVKKVVQWSDQRDVRTRHQVIGRYLEMTWCYSGHYLHSQFLWPPSAVTASDQTRHEQNPGYQRGQPSSCLLMPQKQLRTMSKRILEVAKSELFPTGLLPVLRSQALKLDELSNKLHWYEAWLQTTGSTDVLTTAMDSDDRSFHEHISQAAVSENPSARVDPLPGPVRHPPEVNVEGNHTCSVSEYCIVSFTRTVCDNFTEIQGCDSLISRPQWISFRQVCSAPLEGTNVDFSTVMRILQTLTSRVLSCLSTHTAGNQEALLLQLHRSFQSSKQALLLLGLFPPTGSSGENVTATALYSEPGGPVFKTYPLVSQFVYVFSRRLNLATGRLLTLLNAHIDRVTRSSVAVLHILSSRVSTDPASRQASYHRIISALLLMYLMQAKLCQLSAALRHLSKLFGMLGSVVQYFTPRTEFAKEIISSSTKVDLTPPDWGLLFTELSTHLKLSTPLACKVATFVSTLCRWYARLERMQEQLQCTECEIQELFSKFWSKLIPSSWLSPVTDSEECAHQQCLSSFMSQFTECMISTVPVCTLNSTASQEASPISLSSGNITTRCSLHNRIYRRVLSSLIDAFCTSWLQQLQWDSRQENGSVMLHMHTEHLHLFTRLVTATGNSCQDAQTTVDTSRTALATVLCESDAFHRLHSSTLGPYDCLLMSTGSGANR